MNKRTFNRIFTCLFLLGVGWSCEEPEPLSIIPNISHSRLEFIPVNPGSDSLILYLNFEDGDGDIGLEGNQNAYPYHPFNFIIDKNRRLVTIGGTENEPPFYSIPLNNNFEPAAEEVLYSETDSRPSYNCQNYEIIEYTDAQKQVQVDTFLIEKNPNNKNIYVEFYRKINGSYEFIDWGKAFSTTSCGTDFNARFPVFDSDNLGKSLSGTLRYAMVSEGFNIILKKDTFKIRTYIKDRALHDSNYAESPDITLDMITN